MQNQKARFERILEKPIEILLSSTGGGKNKLDLEENRKVADHIYATKYLEGLGLEPTADNIKYVLTTKPTDKCRIEDGIIAGIWLLTQTHTATSLK